MPIVRDLMQAHVDRNDDSDINFGRAVDAYDPDIWYREVTHERFPLDALVFAEHQTPWVSFEEFTEERHKYDDETNNWLTHYVNQMALNVDNVPPVLLDITPTGVALVDGCHRTSALLIFTNRIRIDSWVVR
jgi:hypothetical protein